MINPKQFRAVFDTNIIIAAHLTRNPRSPTRELLERWKNEEFELAYSTALLMEYQEKFKERGIENLTEEFLATLIGSGIYIHLNPDDIRSVIIDDPDDDIVIASAVISRATHIVTYDSHFDCLGGEYQGIKILDGLHFLYEVRGNVRTSDSCN